VKRSRAGITLVEVLVSTSIFVGGTGALLIGMNQVMKYGDYLSQIQYAVNVAQGQLETLAALPVSTLRWDPSYAGERSATGACYAGTTVAGCKVLSALANLPDGRAPLPNGRLIVQIRNADALNPSNPEVLDLHVAVCWQARSGQWIVGEDNGGGVSANRCNGRLDAGEDANNNGWMDTPVMVSTRVSMNN